MEPCATWTLRLNNSRNKLLLLVVARRLDVPEWTFEEHSVKVTVINSTLSRSNRPDSMTFYRHSGHKLAPVAAAAQMEELEAFFSKIFFTPAICWVSKTFQHFHVRNTNDKDSDSIRLVRGCAVPLQTTCSSPLSQCLMYFLLFQPFHHGQKSNISSDTTCFVSLFFVQMQAACSKMSVCPFPCSRPKLGCYHLRNLLFSASRSRLVVKF